MRNVLAGFMILWLSGILFLFCGQMPSMQAKEFCPLGKGKSHCDKVKSENDLPLVSRETGNQSFDCCGFMPAVFDKTRKLEKSQQTIQPADKVKIDFTRFSSFENDLSVAENYFSLAISTNKIFIKNCVFRI